MTVDRGLIERIRSRGEEVLTQISAELKSNPRFVRALEGALRGREKLEAAAGQALRQMNVPTRGELKRASSRIEALEREMAELRAQARAKPGGARRPSRRKSTTGRKGPAVQAAKRKAPSRRAKRPSGSGTGK